MLMTLSPQGVAKINSDVTRGVACQETLADLQAAFDLRNDPTFQSNQAAVRLSQRLKRELSASELNVLGDHADLLQASSPALGVIGMLNLARTWKPISKIKCRHT
eukprot:TRINITY_DN8868_c0_g1_i2.p2 TRINITY_DN8868_c0_g1~~TRINITY_DN8868_c0_g1_i2.p2  ORF type:complete len:105 (-),score=12.18 TRINITY_DN8868_c0_g1_i2:454-768(-)